MSFKTICTMAATATFVMLGAIAAEAGKAQFDRCKPHCNVGTIGTVDHSKTLVRQSSQRANLKGFGKFTLTHRKARRNERAGTYAMRIKAMQIRTPNGSTRNDRRVFKTKTGHRLENRVKMHVYGYSGAKADY
jgi:nucleoid DNA-binding protein